MLSASDLDIGFGDSGRVVGSFGDESRFSDVVLLSDGKILAVGTITHAVEPGVDTPPAAGDFLVARYNPDGQLDLTFGGGDGFVVTDFTPDGLIDATGYVDGASAIAVLPDGDFIVVGHTSEVQFDSNTAIARYNADGTLDSAFDGDGKVITEVPSKNSAEVLHSAATSVTVTPAGKILVAGNSFGRTSDDPYGRFTLIRYNANGTLDSTFGTNGITTTQHIYFQLKFGGPEEVVVDIPAMMNASDVELLPNGKILVGGTSDVAYDYGVDQSSFALARYNADGSLDTTFGEDGWVASVDGNGETGNFLVRPDGSIILVGSRDLGGGQANLTLARYTSAGVRDRSFGDDGTGYATIPFRAEGEEDVLELSPSFGSSVIALPNGQLLVAGTTDPFAPGVGTQLVAARLSSDGRLDTTFGNGGKLVSSALSNSSAALLQPDGKVVVVGSSGGDRVRGGQATLARFDAQGTATLSGTIYNDANQSGGLDPGETPLAGWTAYVDVNNNGRVDANEPFAVTDASGQYTMNGLAAGAYRIREIREDGWIRSEPSGVYPFGYYDVTVTDGQALTGNDFGNFQPAVGTPPPVNAAPTAVADAAETTQDTPLEIDLLANDTDDTGINAGSVEIVAAPANGTAVVNPVTGAVLYVPNKGAFGTDSFTYRVADEQGLASAPINATISISAATLSGQANATLPPSAIAGEKAKGKLVVTIHNQSSTAVRGRAVLDVFLSEDGTYDAGDARITGASKNVRLQPDASKTVNLKLHRIPSVSSDSYQVLTTITSPDGTVAVLPSATLNVVSPFVDLQATVSRLPVTPLAPGGRATMTIDLSNAGNIATAGETTIQLFTSSDATLDDNDVLIATLPARVRIKAGGAQQKQLRFELPEDIGAGSIRLIAKVNPEGAIAERNAVNNLALSDPLAAG